MELEKLEVCQIARELSKIGWDAYQDLKSEHRFSIGQQCIRAIDSIGANVAEGFGRYHYLDSIKFYYNARGSSLWEAKHWIDLLQERNLIADDIHRNMIEKLDRLGIKLNNFIGSIKTRASKNNRNNNQ